MPLLITQMLLIAKERGLEDGTRIGAVEVLAIICEEAPAMARKFPMLAQQFVPVLISLATEIEEDESWAIQDSDDVRHYPTGI